MIQRTPGGDFAKAAKSETQDKSGIIVSVNPDKVTLILDSLAIVSGTIKEVKHSLTIDLGAEDYHTSQIYATRPAPNITRLRGAVNDRNVSGGVAPLMLISITSMVKVVSSYRRCKFLSGRWMTSLALPLGLSSTKISTSEAITRTGRTENSGLAPGIMIRTNAEKKASTLSKINRTKFR